MLKKRAGEKYTFLDNLLGFSFGLRFGGLVGGIGEGGGGGGPNIEEGLDAFGVLGGLGRMVSKDW